MAYWAGECWAHRASKCGRAAIVAAIIAVLGVLVYFKYSRLLAETFGHLVGAKVALPEIAAPLGLSYFTFRFISYLVDVKRGVIEERSYGRFLLYTFFFPIMPAGPIERYGTIDKQSRLLEGFRWDLVQEGAPRILWGLFKKIVLGDSISFLADGLSDPGADCLEYWVAVYAATMKICLDFSAYTDIAVGTARLFGYRIMENFNNPYFQRNLSLVLEKLAYIPDAMVHRLSLHSPGRQPQRLRENRRQHGHRLGRHRNMARSRLAFLVLGALSRSGAHCVAVV